MVNTTLRNIHKTKKISNTKTTENQILSSLNMPQQCRTALLLYTGTNYFVGVWILRDTTTTLQEEIEDWRKYVREANESSDNMKLYTYYYTPTTLNKIKVRMNYFCVKKKAGKIITVL